MKTLATIALLFCLSSCASIFQPGPDFISVSTNPPGATILLDNIPVGISPMTVAMKRTGNNGVITARLERHQSQVVQVERHLNGSTLLNIFWGIPGILFFVVDAAGGNLTGWDETPIFLELRAY